MGLEWRCTSYSKWGYSIAMSVYQRAISFSFEIVENRSQVRSFFRSSSSEPESCPKFAVFFESLGLGFRFLAPFLFRHPGWPPIYIHEYLVEDRIPKSLDFHCWWGICFLDMVQSSKVLPAHTTGPILTMCDRWRGGPCGLWCHWNRCFPTLERWEPASLLKEAATMGQWGCGWLFLVAGYSMAI